MFWARYILLSTASIQILLLKFAPELDLKVIVQVLTYPFCEKPRLQASINQ